MKNNKQNFNFFSEKRKIKFATNLKPHTLKLEIVFLLISVIGYFLKKNEIIGGTLLILSFIYFFLAFAEYNRDNRIIEFTHKILLYVISWSKAVSLVGIVYIFTKWIGNKEMLLIGIIPLTLSSIIMLFFILKGYKDEFFSLKEFSKSVVIILTSTYFYFLY